MTVRGIRGAISVEANTTQAIRKATIELLEQIIEKNEVNLEDISCVIFTMTQDLDALYPAAAAREIGFSQVPLLCFNEMKIQGSMEKVLRVLMLVNTEKTQKEIKHVYLGQAQKLRPDLTEE